MGGGVWGGISVSNYSCPEHFSQYFIDVPVLIYYGSKLVGNFTTLISVNASQMPYGCVYMVSVDINNSYFGYVPLIANASYDFLNDSVILSGESMALSRYPGLKNSSLLIPLLNDMNAVLQNYLGNYVITAWYPALSISVVRVGGDRIYSKSSIIFIVDLNESNGIGLVLVNFTINDINGVNGSVIIQVVPRNSSILGMRLTAANSCYAVNWAGVVGSFDIPIIDGATAVVNIPSDVMPIPTAPLNSQAVAAWVGLTNGSMANVCANSFSGLGVPYVQVGWLWYDNEITIFWSGGSVGHIIEPIMSLPYKDLSNAGISIHIDHVRGYWYGVFIIPGHYYITALLGVEPNYVFKGFQFLVNAPLNSYYGEYYLLPQWYPYIQFMNCSVSTMNREFSLNQLIRLLNVTIYQVDMSGYGNGGYSNSAYVNYVESNDGFDVHWSG
ncbi:hypothetical protein [Vulcanisaeta distributa]|uniref:hypothetical protein n=1 Tax=Vulcanisaeta distributa TaxID=164451 RepID=UPI000AC35AF9|nr:hypothetical protein [Vulcanisaeta distributa]